MTGRAGLSLRDGFDLCGVDVQNLWLHYLSLGGSLPVAEFSGSLTPDGTAEPPTPREHDIIAQTLNEAFLDQGIDAFPVATVLPTPGDGAPRALAWTLRARSEVARQRSRYLHAQASRLQADAARLLAGCDRPKRADRARQRALDAFDRSLRA